MYRIVKWANLFVIALAVMLFIETFFFKIQLSGIVCLITFFVINFALSFAITWTIRKGAKNNRVYASIKEKKKLKCFFKYIYRWLFIIACCFLILFFGVLLFNNFDKVISILPNILATVVTLFLINDIYNGLYRIFINYENRRLFNKKYQFNKTLYNWAEDAILEEGHLHRILSLKYAGRDIVQNMYRLKRQLEIYCDNDITRLRLLKVYIERCVSVNFLSKQIIPFTPIISPSILILIKEVFINSEVSRELIKKVSEQFTSNNVVQNSNGLFEDIINYSTIFIVGWWTLFFIWRILTRNKQRLYMIDKVLELSVSEKEKLGNS